MDGVLEDVGAGLFESDPGSHLHGELPGEGVPGLLDLWDPVCVSADELFEALDVGVDVRFFADANEDPGPFDGLQPIHHHKECVGVPVCLVLLDQGLGLGVNGEDGLVLLVADTVVDVASGCKVSVL